jgi:alkylhydroperoxidase family enzyme
MLRCRSTIPLVSPRIAPLPATGNPPEVQELLDTGGSGVGAQNIFLTLANHPGLLRKFLPYGGKLLMGGKLPARERELVILRTAYRCGSDYEWGQHLRIGRAAGLTDDEMTRIAGGSGFSPADSLLLRATDELVAYHRLAGDTWEALAERFDPAQLIELTMLVGSYAMVAGMLNSIGVEREPGVHGFPS